MSLTLGAGRGCLAFTLILERVELLWQTSRVCIHIRGPFYILCATEKLPKVFLQREKAGIFVAMDMLCHVPAYLLFHTWVFVIILTLSSLFWGHKYQSNTLSHEG